MNELEILNKVLVYDVKEVLKGGRIMGGCALGITINSINSIELYAERFSNYFVNSKLNLV